MAAVATVAVADDGLKVETSNDVAKFDALAKLPDYYKIALVYADWCGACVRFKSTWETAIATKGKWDGGDRQVILMSIESSVKDESAVVQQAAVSSFPTLLFLGPDGELIRPKGEEGQEDYNFGKFRESEQVMMDILNHPEKYGPAAKGQAGGGCDSALLMPPQQGGGLYGLMYGLAYGAKKKGKGKKAASRRKTKRRALRRRRTAGRRR